MPLSRNPKISTFNKEKLKIWTAAMHKLTEEWMSQTRTRLENMLFNEEYADLLFVWKDETKIAAHKNIVFPVCPYFK